MAASNDKRNSQQKLPLSTEGLFHLSDGITLTQGRNNYISAVSLNCNEENREDQHKKAPESREETQGLIAYHKQEVCITPNRSLDRCSDYFAGFSAGLSDALGREREAGFTSKSRVVLSVSTNPLPSNLRWRERPITLRIFSLL